MVTELLKKTITEEDEILRATEPNPALRLMLLLSKDSIANTAAGRLFGIVPVDPKKMNHDETVQLATLIADQIAASQPTPPDARTTPPGTPVNPGVQATQPGQVMVVSPMAVQPQAGQVFLFIPVQKHCFGLFQR